MLDLLVRFANLTATGSLGFPVGLVVAGKTFCGVIGRDLDFAAQFDQTASDLAEHLDAVATSEPERVWAIAIRDGFTNGQSQSARAHERFRDADAMHHAMEAADQWDPDHGYDMPVEAIRKSLPHRHPRSGFTLSDAHLVTDAGALMPVGMMRVVIGQVGAWWNWYGEIPEITPKAEGASRISLTREPPEVLAPISGRQPNAGDGA
jgi:hypothetical protein